MRSARNCRSWHGAEYHPAMLSMVVGSVLLASISVPLPQGDTRAPVAWHTDLVAAHEFAAERGKPLLIVFR